MKFKRIMILLSLTASAFLFAGCGAEKTAPGSTGSSITEGAEGEGSSDNLTSNYDIKSTVLIDKSYWAGSNVRVRMLFDKNGNCKYGYVGKYDLQTTADGIPIITFVYYADQERDQMASSTFALRDNGDGTYTKTLYMEGKSPDYEDASVTTDLVPEEGTDGLMGGAAFEGIYTSSDGQYYTFHSDGTFAMETWMGYIADDTYIELIGADSSTLYTYMEEDDFEKLTLYKDEKKVMDLATEEALAAKADDPD